MNVGHRAYSGLQGLTRWDLPTRGYLTHLPSSANQQSHSDSTDLKPRNEATSYLNPKWTAALRTWNSIRVSSLIPLTYWKLGTEPQ